MTWKPTYEECSPEATQPVFPEYELSENQQTLTCPLLAWSAACCCTRGCGISLGLWTANIKITPVTTGQDINWLLNDTNLSLVYPQTILSPLTMVQYKQFPVSIFVFCIHKTYNVASLFIGACSTEEIIYATWSTLLCAVNYTNKSTMQAFHTYIFKGNGNQVSLGKVPPKLLHDKMQQYLTTVCLK
jgi:hypothetical protein